MASHWPRRAQENIQRGYPYDPEGNQLYILHWLLLRRCKCPKGLQYICHWLTLHLSLTVCLHLSLTYFTFVIDHIYFCHLPWIYICHWLLLRRCKCPKGLEYICYWLHLHFSLTMCVHLSLTNFTFVIYHVNICHWPSFHICHSLLLRRSKYLKVLEWLLP